jgi:hypothetical protein
MCASATDAGRSVAGIAQPVGAVGRLADMLVAGDVCGLPQRPARAILHRQVHHVNRADTAGACPEAVPHCGSRAWYARGMNRTPCRYGVSDARADRDDRCPRRPGHGARLSTTRRGAVLLPGAGWSGEASSGRPVFGAWLTMMNGHPGCPPVGVPCASHSRRCHASAASCPREHDDSPAGAHDASSGSRPQARPPART